MHFLHTGVIPGCFSNLLKTKNVLLDEYRFPKLSDYGMSIIIEEIEKFEVCSWQSNVAFLPLFDIIMIDPQFTCCLFCVVQAKGEKSKPWYDTKTQFS